VLLATTAQFDDDIKRGVLPCWGSNRSPNGARAQALLTSLLQTALQPGDRFAYPNDVEPAPRTRRGLRVRAYDSVVGVREFQRLNRAVEAAALESRSRPPSG